MQGIPQDSLKIIYYNIHSLIRFDERIDRLLHELSDQVWDIIVFVETWRAEKQEAWTTEHGHDFYGSGGAPGKRGVGLFTASTFQTISSFILTCLGTVCVHGLEV